MWVATEDHCHYDISRSFDPPLERYQREVGPDKADAFIEKEQNYPLIVLGELVEPHATIREDKKAGDYQQANDDLVN